MSNNLSPFCDDFYIDMCVNTELELPSERDTVMAFFERIQKQYPAMVNFSRRENNEYCLEEDQSTGHYRWVGLEIDRIVSGVVNPAEFEDAYSQHQLVLELAPYMLSVSCLEINSLDVSFVMDFECGGNQDEIITEALFNCSAFNCLLEQSDIRPIAFSPAMVLALSEDNATQARIAIESKTSVYDPRRQKDASDESISLTFTIRQYPSTKEKFDALNSFKKQCRIAEELMTEKIVPNLVRPLIDVIAQKRLS